MSKALSRFSLYFANPRSERSMGIYSLGMKGYGEGRYTDLAQSLSDRTTGQLGQSGRDSLVVQFFRGFSADRTVWSVWRVEDEVRAPTRQSGRSDRTICSSSGRSRGLRPRRQRSPDCPVLQILHWFSSLSSSLSLHSSLGTWASFLASPGSCLCI